MEQGYAASSASAPSPRHAATGAGAQRQPRSSPSRGSGSGHGAASSNQSAAGMSTQAAPAPAGPSIPVRHTHRSQASVSGTVGDAMARQSAGALAAQSTEWSVESVRAHYEPLLAAKQARRDDLQQRLRKQQSRLHSMTAWKMRALDKASSEPNPLDFVLAPDGSAVQSLRVRRMRLALQRLVVRQFIRTARIMRSFRMVARQMRATLPLLLHSPNSSISPEDARQLRKLLDEWNNEPAPIAARQAPLPVSSPATHPRPTFALDASPPPPLPPPPAATDSAYDAFFPAPHVEASRKALDAFYRQRPHAVVAKLLAGLHNAVPLVSCAIRANLDEQSAADRACQSQLQSNSSRWESIQRTAGSTAALRERLRLLGEDVAFVEGELVRQRDLFVEQVSALEHTIRREGQHHRWINRAYFEEVAAKLGNEYAAQLSMVQQGHADWMGTKQKKGNLAERPRPGQAHAEQTTRAPAPRFSAPLAGADAGADADADASAPQFTQLFLPSTLLGTTLPLPPPILPTFASPLAAASSTGSSSSGGEGARAAHRVPVLIPLTPATPLASCTRTCPVDREALLREVQRVLAQHPHRRDDGESADQAVQHNELRQQSQQPSRRVQQRDESGLEDDASLAESAAHHADFEPFFVLPHGSRAHSHARGRSGENDWSDDEEEGNREGLGARRHDDHDHGDSEGGDAAAQEEDEAEQVFAIQRGKVGREHEQEHEEEQEEEKQQQQQQQQQRTPSHERNDSAPPLPPSLLSPPAAALAPLHARTLSEIDWNASGSAVSVHPPRRRHLSVDDRAAQEHQRSLTNPHPMWQLTAEQAAALVEEAEEAEDHSSPHNEHQHAPGTKRPSSGLAQRQTQAQTQSPAATGRSAATHSWRNAGPVLPMATSSFSHPAPTASGSRRPASAAAHVFRSSGGGDASATSTDPAATAAAAAAGVPPSPIPGLSGPAYAVSFRVALAHLQRLGYTEAQARDFAPQVVLVGAIPLPSDDEQHLGEERAQTIEQQQAQAMQHSRVLGFVPGATHARSASTRSARVHAPPVHAQFQPHGPGSHAAQPRVHMRAPSLQQHPPSQQQQQSQQASWIQQLQSATRPAPYIHARGLSSSGSGGSGGGGGGVMSARPASARPAAQQQQPRAVWAVTHAQGQGQGHSTPAPRHRPSASVSFSARSSGGSSGGGGAAGAGGPRPSSAVVAARTDALVAGLPTDVATHHKLQPTPPPHTARARPASARTSAPMRPAPPATAAPQQRSSVLRPSPPTAASMPDCDPSSDTAHGFLLSPS